MQVKTMIVLELSKRDAWNLLSLMRSVRPEEVAKRCASLDWHALGELQRALYIDIAPETSE